MPAVHELESRIRIVERRITFAICVMTGVFGLAILSGASGLNRDESPRGLIEKVDIGTVQLGMMVPYFGNKLPVGYVWADGKTMWPDAEWVPKHLRKTVPVPNMSAQLLGGCVFAEENGQTYNTGAIVAEIPGTSFQLPDGKEDSRTAEAYMIQWVKGDVIPGAVQGAGTPDVQIRIVSIPDKWLSYSGAVTGSHKVVVPLDKRDTAPSHVMCRWIIRVE